MNPEMNNNFENTWENLEQKSYYENWFDISWDYEVQDENWDETLYWVVNRMLSIKWFDEKNRVVIRDLIMTWVEEWKISPKLYKWDLISLEEWDLSSFYLTISDKTHVLNIINKTVSEDLNR